MTKHFSLPIALLLVACVTLASSGTQPEVVTIPLSESVNIESLERPFDGSPVTVRQLQHQSEAEAGGYILEAGETLREALQQYEYDQDFFQNDRIRQIERLINETSDAKVQEALHRALNIAIRARGSSLAIVSVEILGMPRDVDLFKDLIDVHGALEIEPEGNQELPALEDIGTIACSTTEINGKEFVPSWGKAITDKDSYSRYIYQWMYWHSRDRLKWLQLNYDSTFEPDAFFYNYDRKAYGDSPSGYWSTDLPEPYVDTQFGDSPDEKAVTIGSSAAVYLVDQRVYYTVTRMKAGGGDSSWTKLSSQRGRRSPDWCFRNAFCSYGCNSINNFKTVEYRDFTSPGCRQYWWYWWGSSSAPCR